MKHTDFETGQPLFNTEELKSAVRITATIICEAIRTRNFKMSDWQDYIDRWGLANYQTEEVLTHISETIQETFKTIQKNG